MRLPLRRRGRGVVFNITPLIDVVFNLVIFFLVASHFARSEPMETVTLPSASHTAEDEIPRRLTITILKVGTYSVNANSVTLSDIEQMIIEGAGATPEEYAVRIRGDKSAPYEFIEPIMLACVRAGVVDFGFKVVEE